jgi:hypothetical protein
LEKLHKHSIVPPETVAEIGGGSVDHGHEVLDELVKHVRNEHIPRSRRLVQALFLAR